jgi:hypothetical protein
MAITPNGLWVQGPRVRPARYGLFSVAQPGDTSDPHWMAGVSFEDTLCADIASTTAHCGDTSPMPGPKDIDGGPLFRLVDPFTVYGSYACGTGGRKASDAFAIASARLAAREELGVERVFWTGVTNDEVLGSSLADGDAAAGLSVVDLTGASTLDPVTALDLLEEAMGACIPGAGVIHVPLRAASSLASQFLVVRDGDSIYTHTGQSVVFGSGYPGTGPANVAVAANEAWLFGTGQIMVWRGDTFLTPELPAQAVDKTLNDITVFAERTYAVGFSCCIFAVRMFLSCCHAGIT